uniref:Lectin/glucanase superfamily protein n=1 Tax=viral metagenome TaxID=1070528 RepID=A0A6M3XLE5_9ZZZZ
MLLNKNSLSAERERGCSFAETFENASAVVENGGAITSTPTVDFGMTTDGTDDVVTYPAVNSVKSISFWITLQTTTEDIMQLSSSHSIEASSGTLTATGLTSPTFYVNGVATATITTARSHVTVTTATAFNADAIQIGQDDSFGQFKIEDLKMWTNVLITKETLDYTNNDTFTYRNKAVIDLPMTMENHDPTNVRTLDVSGNGNHGTFEDTPTKLTTSKGYSFDGTNDDLSCGNVGTMKSAAFWIKPTTTSEDIADMDGGTHTIEVGSGTITATGWSSPAIYVDGVVSSTLVAGIWQHVVITTATGFAASAVKFGKETTYLDGSLMEAKLLPDELTPLQVADLYITERKKLNDI